MRVFECDINNGGDMLLFQQGTYDWGEGLFFKIDLNFFSSDDKWCGYIYKKSI